MARKNAFYAQSGGVTAVINASAAGVIEAARENKQTIGKVYAGRNGIIGALTEDLIDTGKESKSAIEALKHTRSAPGQTSPLMFSSSPHLRMDEMDPSAANFGSLVKQRQPGDGVPWLL